MGREPVKFEIITLDGWTTCYPRWFRLFIHPPPRPYSDLTQLWLYSLSRNGGLWLPWTFGIGLIIAGFYTHWALIALGGAVLGLYGVGLCHGVNHFRNARLVTGLIRDLKPHPRLSGFSVAGAILPDGTAYEVTVYTPLAEPLIEQDERCEAIFFPGPFKNAKSVVLGVRPAPAFSWLPNPPRPERPEQTTATESHHVTRAEGQISESPPDEQSGGTGATARPPERRPGDEDHGTS